MPWARLDDGFHDHPKVDGLSLAAVGLYTLCLTWAHRHRKTAVLPGHITEARVAKLAGKDSQRLSTELLTSGLWEPEDGLGGYVIHDFTDYLPKDRDPEERRQAGKRGAAKRWQIDGKRDGNLPSPDMATDMATDSSRASTRAFPSRPVPSTTQEQPQDLAPDKPTRKPDEIWDALLEACHVEPSSVTASSRGAYNRAVADLKAVDATPEEIRRRAAIFRGQWRDVSLTPTALARRWAECERPFIASAPQTETSRRLDDAMRRAEAAEAQQTRKALP